MPMISSSRFATWPRASHALRLTLAALLVALAAAMPTAARPEGPLSYLPLYGEMLADYTQAVDAEVGTRVDYPGLLAEPRWKEMVGLLAAVDSSKLLGRDDKLAFWINAYNILAIDLVLRHYPVESIRDIGFFLRPVWKREAGRIGGRGYSLSDIEHRILRGMKDPRMHGAIVCASVSCPNLARLPYRGDRLDAQLEAANRAWLARPEKGLALERPKGIVRISRVFSWFARDFGGREGVLEFVRQHAPEADADWIGANMPRLRIAYFDYDWALNE